VITQKFKGDATELKVEASASPAFDLASLSKDQFLESGFTAAPFLLMLYDEGRMPFSDRIPRDSFVEFIQEALSRFPFTGTFDSYLFILEKVFGEGSGVLFDVPAAGKLEILVNAASSILSDLVAVELSSGQYVTSELVNEDLALLQVSGISGIDSEYKLTQLLAELIPAGIFPDVTLAFYSIYDFIAEYGGEHSMIDDLFNQIVFFEEGA
jgi:hypothetical protein